MNRESVSVEFSHDIQAALKQMALIDKNKTLAKALGKGAQVFVKTFRGMVPVKTGMLKKTFKSKRQRDQNNQVIFKVTSALFYLRFIEKGTKRGVRALHLVQRTHDSSSYAAQQEVKKSLVETVKSNWRTELGKARRRTK